MDSAQNNTDDEDYSPYCNTKVDGGLDRPQAVHVSGEGPESRWADLVKTPFRGKEGAGGSDSSLYPKARDTQVPGPSQQQLCLPIPGRTRDRKTQHWTKE